MSTSDLHPLAERLARGEEAAFAELYDACADRLHRYLASRLGSPHAAADVVQNAFLRAVKSRRRFRAVENPIAYVFQIARNEALRLSKKRTIMVRSLDGELEIIRNVSSTTDDSEMAETALRRLATDDREIVELKLFGGLTFAEIAVVTDMPPATAATRYRRALESLRPWMAKQLR